MNFRFQRGTVAFLWAVSVVLESGGVIVVEGQHTHVVIDPLTDANATAPSQSVGHVLLTPQEMRVRELRLQVDELASNNAAFEIQALRNMSSQILPKTRAPDAFSAPQLRDSFTSLPARKGSNHPLSLSPCEGFVPHPSLRHDPCHVISAFDSMYNSSLRSGQESDRRKLYLISKERRRKGDEEVLWRRPTYKQSLRRQVLSSSPEWPP
eukprot:INCI19897.1.p1 GENE.INCI19897.1~~INCI19897.1.p1  ORF type:complete len:209 (+),score=24.19 INCI19897.1:176-802(+)